MEIKTFKILKIYRHTENKDGEAYVDKTGKPYSRVSIQVDESEIKDSSFEGWLSMFDSYGTTSEWKEGTEIEGVVDKKEVGDRIYWNLRVPTRFDQLDKRVEALEEIVGNLGQIKKEEKVDKKLPF